MSCLRDGLHSQQLTTGGSHLCVPPTPGELTGDFVTWFGEAAGNAAAVVAGGGGGVVRGLLICWGPAWELGFDESWR